MSHKSIFEFPDAYDAIMRASTDQLQLEADVIRNLLMDRNQEAGRILEIACGTSPHGIPLSQHGFSVTGLDLSAPMLEGAGHRARVAGIDIDLVQGDFTDFNLDVIPFDCAIFMSETFPLITRYEDIASHFRSVHRHLNPGGIYLVDIDAQEEGYRTQHKVWGQRSITLSDGQVDVWYENQPADWVRGINRLTMYCNINTESVQVTTVDPWEIRVYNPWTLSVLIQSLEGWRLQGFYAWQDLSEDIADQNNYFMMLEKI